MFEVEPFWTMLVLSAYVGCAKQASAKRARAFSAVPQSAETAAATGRTWQNIVGRQLMHEAGASKLWKANTCLQALACTHLIFIHIPHTSIFILKKFRCSFTGQKGQEMCPVGPGDWNMLARLVRLIGYYVLHEHSLAFS
eukprot:s3427_g8.t1